MILNWQWKKLLISITYKYSYVNPIFKSNRNELSIAIIRHLNVLSLNIYLKTKIFSMLIVIRQRLKCNVCDLFIPFYTTF
jgi:hypothetical protein